MVAKGHNHGLCRKCGKIHAHGMKGKHHSEESKRKISRANKGRSSKLKGMKCPKSPEGKARIAESNRNRVWTHEMREKISKAHKGRVSPMKGYRYTPLQRIRKCFAMRNSVKFHEAIRRRDEEKVKEFLRSLYGIPEEIVFFPASKYEHEFSRFVLIEGRRYKTYDLGFITRSGLRECPIVVTSDANRSEIPVVM